MRYLGLAGLLFAGLVLAACAASGHGKPPAKHAAGLPRIHERFTPLTCPRKRAARATTLGIEGCAEQRILHADGEIVADERTIYHRLSAGGRVAFVRGERAWLAYRKAYCSAWYSLHQGGSIAPVLAASCEASTSESHVRTLAAFLREVGPH